MSMIVTYKCIYTSQSYKYIYATTEEDQFSFLLKQQDSSHFFTVYMEGLLSTYLSILLYESMAWAAASHQSEPGGYRGLFYIVSPCV